MFTKTQPLQEARDEYFSTFTMFTAICVKHDSAANEPDRRGDVEHDRAGDDAGALPQLCRS